MMSLRSAYAETVDFEKAALGKTPEIDSIANTATSKPEETPADAK